MSEGGLSKEDIKNWILQKAKSPPSEELTVETPLLEKRIITSLQIMDLILFLEKKSGKKLNLSDLKPSIFQNIQSIHDHFFGAQG